MKKILVALFMFCQFPFFIEALDYFDVFEEAIELDKLNEIDDSITKANTFTDILAKPLKAESDTTSLQKETDEIIKSKSFYEIEYGDIFFEIGILYNKYTPRAIYGIGFESKHENSYTIYQNCFDLVYIENIFDLMWTPSVFLGNSMIKIGTGIPLAIGIYEYIFNIGIGIRPSIKLTVANISFELFYQCLMKVFISCDAVKSNEFGLIIKIGTCTWLDDFLR